MMTEASQSNADPERATLIAFENVSKRYDDGRVVALDNVCLEIVEGEFVTVMGPSGSGKSTMLHLMGALDQPCEGQVKFGGQSLSKLDSLDRLRALNIGFVFQSFHLLPNLTALENVQLPMFEGERPKSAWEAEARRLLTLVGLEDRVTHRPNQLSIGQRQRVAIARALANEPRIVLADEPTGSLDSKSGQEVMELLSKLNAELGTTLVIVTHDRSVADYGSRLLCMLDGRVEEDLNLAASS